ncbi:transmembrane signal receptor [Lithospermum erythrorhizon]|uniref:Transmembrane signal receptor n=1 Tax=Lithospermum erythrorhizon TaxID=34254 RepID=A0AAV3QYE6_LITER
MLVYVDDIIVTGSHGAEGVSTPLASTITFPTTGPFSDPTKYRQVVGALQYLTLTRPDLAYSVNKVCQFMHAPLEAHWDAVKRILRYLQSTQDLGLHLRPMTLYSLTAFSDADWAGCPTDRRSTGGHAIYLGSTLVSWKSRKKRTVSRSSTEAEYKALADCTVEIVWVLSLLSEIGFSLTTAPVLWCDNIGATYLAANPVYHARTIHIEIDYHFLCEKVAAKTLSVQSKTFHFL